MAKRKKYRALIFDLDDTAIKLGLNNLPSARVKRAVQRLIRRGVPVLVATGRVLNQASPVLSALGIRDLCILSNGAIIYDPLTQSAVESRPIAPDALRKAMRIIKPDLKRTYVYRLFDEVLYSPESIEQDIFSVYVVPISAQTAKRYQKQLASIGGLSVHYTAKTWQGGDNVFLTFNDARATKQVALSHLFTRLNIRPQDVVAVGDSENDLPMIIAAGMGVAMDNATEGLKSVADYIAPSVDQDGLAHVIERFFPDQ